MNESKGPVVWVLKEQMVRNELGSNAADYSDCMTFGDLNFVTTTDLPYHPRSQIKLTWEDEVNRFIEAYDQNQDFIVCSGAPTAIFQIGYMLGAAGKRPRFLVWKRMESRYRVFCPMELPALDGI